MRSDGVGFDVVVMTGFRVVVDGAGVFGSIGGRYVGATKARSS